MRTCAHVRVAHVHAHMYAHTYEGFRSSGSNSPSQLTRHGENCVEREYLHISYTKYRIYINTALFMPVLLCDLLLT